MGNGEWRVESEIRLFAAKRPAKVAPGESANPG
jgi:hypothetical protein